MHWDTDDIHTIHCFGDSLTAGYGAVPGAGWVEVVAKRHPEINWTITRASAHSQKTFWTHWKALPRLHPVKKASSSWVERMISSAVFVSPLWRGV